MSKLEFRPEDFKEISPESFPMTGRQFLPNLAAEIAKKKLDAWLSEQVRVYGNRGGMNWDRCQRKVPECGIISNFSEDTHTAILVCIEEIKKKPITKTFTIVVDPIMSPDRVNFRHPETGELLGQIVNIKEEA